MGDDLTTYDDFMAQQRQFSKAEKRTQRSDRKATRRCLGKILIALNFIFLVMGATIVGYGVHINRSKENKLTQDAVAIGVISMGALFLVLSTLGICGICLDSKGVLVTFEVLLIIMAGAQIAVAVIVLSHNGDASSLITDAWKAASDDTRDDMQNYFNCCGLTDMCDLKGPSCVIQNDTNACPVGSHGCLTPIMDDLQANYAAVGWICAGVAFLQLLASTIGCVILCKRWGPTNEEALLLDDGRDRDRRKGRSKGGDTFANTGWISE
jgi:hypothetical protein